MRERPENTPGREKASGDERSGENAPPGDRGCETPLASIYATAEAGSSSRGRDLSFTARVRRRELRQSPLRIRVPLDIESPDGDRARRAWRAPDDDGAADGAGDSPPADAEWIELRVPADVPTGSVLRLRGSGEVVTDGRPGDLYVWLDIDEDTDGAAARAAAQVGLALFAVLAFVLVLLQLV